MDSKSTLVGVFFFFVFNPFISPIPIGTDVQLPVFIIAALLGLLALINNKFYLDRQESIMLFIAFWTMLFLGLDGEFNPRYRLGLPLGVLVLFVIRIYWHQLSPRLLLYSVWFNSAGVFFHFFVPQLFVPIASAVTREIKNKEIGERGASGFCPESGLACAIFVVLLLSLIYFRKKNELNHSQFLFGVALCVVSILLTKSATGILFIFIIISYFLLMYSNLKQKIIFTIFIIIGTFIVLNGNFLETTRAGALLLLAIENPLTILVLDGSLAERAAGISFGFVSLLENIFGYGGGSFPQLAPKLDQSYGVMNFFYTARDQTQGTVSAFGTYTLEFGIVFLFFLGLITWRYTRFNYISQTSVTFALLFILASYSIAFPGIWYLLILARNANKEIFN